MNYNGDQKSKNNQLLKEAVKVAHETNTTAARTNQMLYEHGQKLDRMDHKLDKINGTLNQAENTAKEITSFWYYMKNKVKRAFGFNKGFSVAEKQTDKTDQNLTMAEQMQNKTHLQCNNEGDNIIDEQQRLGDELLGQLRNIKHNCISMGEQMDRQKPKIQKVETKMDKATDKMSSINKILKKQLGK